MKHDYQIGGRVKISGKWRKIELKSFCDTVKVEGLQMYHTIEDLGQIIEAYEPPQPKSYQWVSENEIPSAAYGNGQKVAAALINSRLTETYGDPTVRTYEGEEPEEFRLTGDAFIHKWVGWGWVTRKFCGLQPGDKWRKQPPAPKGGDQ
jgi:hypothetical protein